MPTLDQIPSPVDATFEHAGQRSPRTKEEQSDRRRTLLFGGLAASLLAWVALFNGYPTIFPDTGSYLWTGATHVALWPYRAPGYSVFASSTSMGISTWFTVAMQAIIVVYVVREALMHLIGGARKYVDRCVLASACIFAALTTLPWLVSMLMPDVFAGVLFLCAFLLAFAGELRLRQQFLLASILMISVCSHASLFPIAAVYVAAVFALRLVDRQARGVPPAWSLLVWLLAPILVAGYWTATQNQEMRLGFTLSPSKNTFLLARLFGDGLAPDYLRENCPKRPFISCRYLSRLPKTEQEFLFQHPLVRDLFGHDDEVETIVRGTIFAYPGKFVWSSARQTLLQLFALRTGEEMRLHADNDWNIMVIQRVFPRDFLTFANARQFRDRMLPLANAIAPVHTVFFWLSVAECLVFAGTGRYPKINRFLALAFVFLLINAAVCGALAGVFDRYQNRVAWIIPLCLIAYVCCFIGERQDRAAGQGLTDPAARTAIRSHHPNLVQIPTHRDSENS